MWHWAFLLVVLVARAFGTKLCARLPASGRLREMLKDKARWLEPMFQGKSELNISPWHTEPLLFALACDLFLPMYSLLLYCSFLPCQLHQLQDYLYALLQLPLLERLLQLLLLLFVLLLFVMQCLHETTFPTCTRRCDFHDISTAAAAARYATVLYCSCNSVCNYGSSPALQVPLLWCFPSKGSRAEDVHILADRSWQSSAAVWAALIQNILKQSPRHFLQLAISYRAVVLSRRSQRAAETVGVQCNSMHPSVGHGV